MVLGFAAFCERREPLQCVSVWSIKFWAIFEFFLYFMLIVQFLFFVQVVEACLWRGEDVGSALVVRLLVPGAVGALGYQPSGGAAFAIFNSGIGGKYVVIFE